MLNWYTLFTYLLLLLCMAPKCFDHWATWAGLDHSSDVQTQNEVNVAKLTQWLT